jgi:diguanylate cyclase (GGDEF)-like protein
VKLGIAAKLALLLALVGLVTAGLTGFYAYQASRALLVASAKSELLVSTQVLARRISQNREEITRDLSLLVNLPVSLDALAGNGQRADQLAALFAGLMQANSAYVQIRLISAKDFGLEVVRVDRQGSTPVRVAQDDLQEKGHFAYVSDTLALPAGQTYLSRITVNHESGVGAGFDQPALQQAMPVMDHAGRAAGVIVINVDLNGMFALLAADLPPAFQVLLANGAGDILIHPDRSKTFGFDKGRRELLQRDLPAALPVVTGRSDHVVFETTSASLGDEPLVAAFIGLAVASPANDNRLVLGLAQPLTRVLAQSRQLGGVILQIVTGLSLVCLLAAVVLGRALTQPINAVTKAAQRFASGQLAGSLPLQRNDEIGLLARSFQQMQETITAQVADLQRNQETLEHLSQHDTLTGLPNRRLFQDRLEQALAHARRQAEVVWVLFIDLDDFKAVNDRYGHNGGDRVLKIVGERLLAMMRQVDTVARLGGDEYVVLLGAATRYEHVTMIAQKLLATLNAPIALEAGELRISASIGISRFPQDGLTASDIMANADRAMYAVKAGGAGGHHFFSQP